MVYDLLFSALKMTNIILEKEKIAKTLITSQNLLHVR